MDQEVKSLTYRITRLCIAALIIIVIFSFSPYNYSNEIGMVQPKKENSFIARPNKETNVEASFPGGKEDLEVLVSDAVEKSGLNVKSQDSSTTRIMQITVDAEGVVTNAKTVGVQTDSISSIALKAIEDGPQWRPAIIDGIPVASTIEQTLDLSFKSTDDVSPSLDN